EFHNEANLTHEGLRYKGVAGSWSNGAEFAQYFMEGRKLLRQRFPGIKVGFPGLSPGADAEYRFGHDAGFRLNDVTFMHQAEAAIRAADFLCVHAYYVSMQEVETEAIALVKKYRRMFPDKLMFVTEFSNPDPQQKTPIIDKGKQAKRFYELCRQIPGMGAAYYFIISGSGWDHQALRRDADGRSLGVIEHML
ncbi:MAG TPA: glycosyl hydrolase, partial [Chloroflexota bacterium]|nr:glycosyl hydrolase [Chloroflexota bacterium]